MWGAQPSSGPLILAVVCRMSHSGRPPAVEVGKVFGEGYELMRADHGDKLHAVAVCNSGMQTSARVVRSEIGFWLLSWHCNFRFAIFLGNGSVEGGGGAGILLSVHLYG